MSQTVIHQLCVHGFSVSVTLHTRAVFFIVCFLPCCLFYVWLLVAKVCLQVIQFPICTVCVFFSISAIMLVTPFMASQSQIKLIVFIVHQ